MKLKIKKRVKRLICKCAGHNVVEERYANKYYFVPKRRWQYDILTDEVCVRCGKILNREYEAMDLTRAELLQREWFIEKTGRI